MLQSNMYQLEECEEYNEEVVKLNQEIVNLRKKTLSNETLLSTLKSMVTIFVKYYGIEKVSEITGIEQDNIEKYLQD